MRWYYVLIVALVLYLLYRSQCSSEEQFTSMIRPPAECLKDNPPAYCNRWLNRPDPMLQPNRNNPKPRRAKDLILGRLGFGGRVKIAPKKKFDSVSEKERKGQIRGFKKMRLPNVHIPNTIKVDNIHAEQVCEANQLQVGPWSIVWDEESGDLFFKNPDPNAKVHFPGQEDDFEALAEGVGEMVEEIHQGMLEQAENIGEVIGKPVEQIWRHPPGFGFGGALGFGGGPGSQPQIEHPPISEPSSRHGVGGVLGGGFGGLGPQPQIEQPQIDHPPMSKPSSSPGFGFLGGGFGGPDPQPDQFPGQSWNVENLFDQMVMGTPKDLAQMSMRAQEGLDQGLYHLAGVSGLMGFPGVDWSRVDQLYTGAREGIAQAVNQMEPGLQTKMASRVAELEELYENLKKDSIYELNGQQMTREAREAFLKLAAWGEEMAAEFGDLALAEHLHQMNQKLVDEIRRKDNHSRQRLPGRVWKELDDRFQQVGETINVRVAQMAQEVGQNVQQVHHAIGGLGLGIGNRASGMVNNAVGAVHNAIGGFGSASGGGNTGASRSSGRFGSLGNWF